MDFLPRPLEATRALIDKGRHQLIVDLPEPPLWIDGDLVRLTQALTNLIGNAAKYTRPNGRITVRAAPIDGGQRARVSIQDTGIGIAADMLPRVFDMFTQVRDAVAMAPGGLGIGLTLARHLVEHHGGTVELAARGRSGAPSWWSPSRRVSASKPAWMRPRRRPWPRARPGTGCWWSTTTPT